MKKVLIFATVLVLTLSVLTGCGCTRQDAGMNTRPSTEMTVLPTNIPETTAPLLPETEPATTPMTEAPTDASTGDSAADGGAGNGGNETGNSGNAAETEGARSRIR